MGVLGGSNEFCGQEFSHGVEFVLLISFNEGTLGNQAEHALASLATVMLEFPSLIVQFTQGVFSIPPTFIQMLPCVSRCVIRSFNMVCWLINSSLF